METWKFRGSVESCNIITRRSSRSFLKDQAPHPNSKKDSTSFRGRGSEYSTGGVQHDTMWGLQQAGLSKEDIRKLWSNQCTKKTWGVQWWSGDQTWTRTTNTADLMFLLELLVNLLHAPLAAWRSFRILKLLFKDSVSFGVVSCYTKMTGAEKHAGSCSSEQRTDPFIRFSVTTQSGAFSYLMEV